MELYVPLTLGARLAPHSDEGSAGLPDVRTGGWREGARRGSEETTRPYPEAEVFELLRSAAGRSHGRYWLVLGEPGAGKSTLLGEWFRRWAVALGAPHPGLEVPVLVRLRELDAADLRQPSEVLADRLWQLGVESRAELGLPAETTYRGGRGRLFRPVWLLDGLDELAPACLGEAAFQRLANLPGGVVLSCRTAVYESRRPLADRYRDPTREYEVLGLDPFQQLGYLSRALADDTERAMGLYRAVRTSRQMEALASSPLMLDLISRVAEPDRLPATRAEFYEQAVRTMWQRKLEVDAAALYTSPLRTRCLTALAAAMGMDLIEAPVELLLETAQSVSSPGMGGPTPDSLIESLVRAGLIRLDHRRETFAFVHLTFQEYFLASSMVAEGFERALQLHWSDARYEETLGLLISLLVAEGKWDEVASGVRWLISLGETMHREGPCALRRGRRSPLRVILHVLSRSGVELSVAPARPLVDCLWRQISGSVQRETVVAADPESPVVLLGLLAQESHGDIRRALRENRSTPPQARVQLEEADRPGIHVRDPEAEFPRWWSLALDPATPTERLFEDDMAWHWVTRVAADPGSPPELLARVADAMPSGIALMSVAANPSLPLWTLSRLIRAEDGWVRAAAARNPSLPRELLGRLAQDAQAPVRAAVATNPGLPLEILARLADDSDPEVRWSVATGTVPPDLLGRLAQDGNSRVRARAAENSRAPAELLARLASDQEANVRSAVASNPNTHPGDLARLAEDDDEWVRGRIAARLSVSPELLGRLGGDRAPRVRAEVAANPSTPPDLLPRLARDENRYVRIGVARNPAAPADLLAGLAIDVDQAVRRRVAENPNTPPEVLPPLVRDEDDRVRRSACRNPNTLLEEL